MSSEAHFLDHHGGATPRRASISSDHSEIPSYPRSDISAPAIEDVTGQDTTEPHDSDARASLQDDGDLTATFSNARHQQQPRPDTASTTASFASASTDSHRRFALAEVPNSHHHRTQKPTAPSRIGRDFEALLASDETYVLRDVVKVALDREDSPSGAGRGLLPSASTSSNRVVVQRRRDASSSSSLVNDLTEADEHEEFVDITPRPHQGGVFQSSQNNIPPSGPSGTILKSVSGQIRRHGAQIPASPDRTTSLQRNTPSSPNAPPSSFQREAPAMSSNASFKTPPRHDGADGTVRLQPRLQNSIGLEEEILATPSSQSNVANGASSTGTFRQRMKKTSGFLRKFRKDSSSTRRDQQLSPSNAADTAGSIPPANSFGRSGASETTPGISLSGRRGSRASLTSQSGSSTNGTSKVPHFAPAEGVAVPSIPERFIQSSASSYSNLAVSSAASQTSAVELDTAGMPETQLLTASSKAGVRVPSAPPTMTEWTPGTKFALPERSSSQGHEKKKSLGASDSTRAINLAVQQFTTQMDDAWKQAPAPAVQLADLRNAPLPNQSWGPSPQLPGLDIQRYKERSGSFLEEPDIVSSGGGPDNTSSDPLQTARSLKVSTSSDSKAQAASFGASSNAATGLGIHNGTSASPMIRRADYSAPSQRVDSPQLVESARSSQRNSIDRNATFAPLETAGSGASVFSARSFETAAESAGMNSAGPQFNTFAVSPIGRRMTNDSARTTSPKFSHDHGKSLLPADAELSKSPYPLAGARSNKDETHASQLSDVAIDQGESIRLVTKASHTEDLSPVSNHHDSSTATIVTAPASPDPDWVALPKLAELSEQSFLRPGRNGSLSRGPSTTSASVTGGKASLLAPPTARTSVDASAVPLINGDAGADDSIATSACELAGRCWEEDPTFLRREKIAEWLGGLGLVNRAARGYYFANFDFSGLRLDVAFRRLCDKLFLRAETQQIDRVLAAFSQRYYECNPDTVFGSADVVHSVVFSILLLNTDLHIAELQERMTRQQFVRNTLGAIAESSTDEQFAQLQDDSRSSFSVAHNDLARSTDALPSTTSAANRRNSVAGYLGVRTKQNPSLTNLESSVDSRSATTTSRYKEKDVEIETLLRDIYAAVKSERILLPSPETGSSNAASGRPSGTFSPALGGRKKMAGNDRMMALKRGSIRGIQGLLGGLGPNALLDPSVSPNASRSSTDSWGRPSQSLASSGDRDRMLSPLSGHTPGFASTLSQTIIKESMEEDAANASNATQTALDEEEDDDKLALAGSPWAKEGSLTCKYYWESTGKRAKDKSWTEVFAVVSKGTLSMFRFNVGPSSPSLSKGGALGGGNWLSNATCLGEMPLAHSLANALPPPGYNKSRPHVFALTLPGGKVYFFQTGHEELVNEWVTTCNYWAARTSKEPLAGGVSNMEYGWNKVLPREEEVEELDSFSASQSGGLGLQSGGHASGSTTFGNGDNQSVRSGISSHQGRSVSSRVFSSSTTSIPPSLATSSNMGYSTNERTFINEWRLPQLPTVPSSLSEERQLARLEKQVSLLDHDLTTHNELRTPMLHLYSPKGSNHAKALSNWERKSNWLLQELVKYQNYVDCLKRSMDIRAERRARREVDEMVREGDAMLDELVL